MPLAIGSPYPESRRALMADADALEATQCHPSA
jgi:hypothetical protein